MKIMSKRIGLLAATFLIVISAIAVRSHRNPPPKPFDPLTNDYGDKKMDLIEVCESIPQPKGNPIPFLEGKEMCYWVEKEVK
tara:strand:+ start:82 stop:327 length:246 start_codon:yes stop_codon:yes gene_type:complete